MNYNFENLTEIEKHELLCKLLKTEFNYHVFKERDAWQGSTLEERIVFNDLNTINREIIRLRIDYNNWNSNRKYLEESEKNEW